jgi:hypothetical protein
MNEPNEEMEFRAGLDTAHGGDLLTPDDIERAQLAAIDYGRKYFEILVERGGEHREFVDYLTFCSYRENRRLSPEVTPLQWEKIFGSQAKQMELRYQQERGK